MKANDVEVLEKRLQVAESIIRHYLPQTNLSKPGGVTQSASAGDAALDGARFIPLAGSADQLDLTDTGEYEFHGISSGVVFLNCINQHFPGLIRQDSRMPFMPQPQRPVFTSQFEPSSYTAYSWWQVDGGYPRLPPQDLARALCEYAFSRGSCLLRVVHTPSFWQMFDMLYKQKPQIEVNQSSKFTGLLFSVVALGSMYDVDENDPTNPDHYAVAMDRG